MQRSNRGITCGKCRGFGALELVEDGAVARVECDAGGSEQRAVRGFVHQVPPDSENMLPRTELPSSQPAVLAEPFDCLLQILDVGGGLLVDDDKIGHKSTRAHVFLEAQRLCDNLQIGGIADPQNEDRKVP